MAFGQTITSFIANLYPVDPIAPQVVSNFVRDMPSGPGKGAGVSEFAHNLYPVDPVHPTDLGQQLSSFIKILGHDGLTGSDTTLF